MKKQSKDYNESVKKRYKEYRSQGYTSYESRALSKSATKLTESQKKKIVKQANIKKEEQKLTIEKRRLVYERLGYDSNVSHALSKRSLDVSQLEISKKTGKLKRNSVTKKFIEEDMESWKRAKVIDKYHDKIKDIKNDTVLTRHGMLTHDKRYKGENGKIISIIKNENNLSTKQAYYFFFIMTQNNLSYNETKRQLLTNKEFEEYDKRRK